MPFLRLLLATDFSDASLDAARLAMRAWPPPARHKLVHVASPPAPFPRVRAAMGGSDHAVARAHAEIETSLERAAAELGIPALEATMVEAPVAVGLAEEAALFGADLVVVGARGASLVPRLLGSRARAIMRAAPASVLVGRPPPGAKTSSEPVFRHVAVASDFYPPAAKAASVALEIADHHGTRLSVVHAVDPVFWEALSGAESTPDKRKLETALHDAVHEFNESALQGRAEEMLCRGDPAHALPTFAAENGVDLLVVGTHGPRALERVVLGSVAEAVTERASCSVLLVK